MIGIWSWPEWVPEEKDSVGVGEGEGAAVQDGKVSPTVLTVLASGQLWIRYLGGSY